jgi:hypothetical protein
VAGLSLDGWQLKTLIEYIQKDEDQGEAVAINNLGHDLGMRRGGLGFPS